MVPVCVGAMTKIVCEFQSEKSLSHTSKLSMCAEENFCPLSYDLNQTEAAIARCLTS